MSNSSEHDEAPEISVVLPTLDRPGALVRCIEALLQQKTTHTFEIIVVDNHPQSGVLVELAARFPAVRWLQEPIAGLSQARNCGIGAARGEVIVTTDDDVIPPPDWLELLTAPLFVSEQDSMYPLAATTGNTLPVKVETEAEMLFEAYGGLRHGESANRFDPIWMERWKVGFPHLWMVGTTANSAFRASALRDARVGPFETQLGAGTPAGAWEDLYCFYRLLKAGYRIEYLPGAEVLHAHREGMDALARQLCAYRRGETAFLSLVLQRHGDLRAVGQMLLWIPFWRLRLLAGELCRRMSGRRLYSIRIFWRETLAYLGGPWALWKSRRRR